MAIKEKSFRIGCGRYLQEKGIIQTLGSEVLRLGKSALVLGGETALSVADEAIEKSLLLNKIPYEIIEYKGSCNKESAKEYADYAKKENFEVIIGVGGGVLMDFAKLTASFAALPVINIPTSSATCAAFTPLSVCYTKVGRTVGTAHFEREVDAVLVDPEILATQPSRLLLAGIFDALAKYWEIKHRFSEEMAAFPLGLDWAYVLAQKSFRRLTEQTELCLKELKEGKLDGAFEQILFNTIAVTGVISGIARGSNQTALGHKFYELTRKCYFEESRPYLHGEMVGVGLLLQNHYNGEIENNEFLLSLMKKYKMPACPSDVGVCFDEQKREQYFALLKESSAMEGCGEAEYERLYQGLCYLGAL